MSQDLGTVALAPGQTIAVAGPGPLAFHANMLRKPTRVRVTAPGSYVPPVVPPPPAPIGRTPVPAIDHPAGSFRSLLGATSSGADLVVPAGVYHERADVTKALRSLDLRGVRFAGDGIDVPLQQGLLTLKARVDQVLEGEVTRSTGAGLDVLASGVSIEAMAMLRNLQQGYHGAGITDVTFKGCEIAGNNLRADWPGVSTAHAAGGSRWVVDPFWEAGAGKIVRSLRVTFDGCQVHGNGGPGIWFDINGNDSTIRANHVWDNDLSGIFFEISIGALIEGNRSWHNGRYDSRGWGWPADVLISSSQNVVLRKNIIGADATTSLSVIAQDRGDNPSSTGIRIEDNDILGGGKLVGWYAPDQGNQTLWDPSNGGVGNRYEADDASRFEYRSKTGDLKYFNATPAEEGGRVLTLAEAAAARAQLVAA